MDRQLWAGIALIFVTQLAGSFSLRAEIVARFDAVDQRFDDLKDWVSRRIAPH
jgi:hypothetical protein